MKSDHAGGTGFIAWASGPSSSLSRLIPLLFMALGLVLITGCGGTDTGAAQLPPRVVDIVVLETPSHPLRRQFPGEVRANRSAQMAFRVPGTLVDLPVEEGDFVDKGERMARLDPRQYENERRGRQADLTEARRHFERIEQAYRARAVTEAERDQARARFEVARAELDMAETRLEDTELLAPFRGRVARRLIDNFQNVPAGQTVLVLEDISELDVRVQLPEQDVIQLISGVSFLDLPVGEIIFDALPGQSFPAWVREVESRADPRTNTYRLTLGLPRPEEANILPGMAATFLHDMSLVAPQAAFFLPVQAVQATPSGSSYVWLQDQASGRVHRRDVHIDRFSGSHVVVTQGLVAGDRVVTSGAAYLAEAEVVQERSR